VRYTFHDTWPLAVTFTHIGATLRAELAMRTTGPDAQVHPSTAFVFGNDCGERVVSIRTLPARRSGSDGIGGRIDRRVAQRGRGQRPRHVNGERRRSAERVSV
jgi:hypothetical protein